MLRPETVVQATTAALADAGWSVPLSFVQFNPNLGTLQDVAVGVLGTIAGTVAIENLGVTPTWVNIDLLGTIVVFSSGGPLTSARPETSTGVALGTYDGTTDFSGNSGSGLSLVPGVASSA
jgi:hypothetical protein